MLTIFILAGIATAFARKAFDKERNRYMWGTIGVLSYFVAQFIAGLIVSAINIELLQNQGFVTGLSLLTGFLGVGIAYFLLNRLPDPDETFDVENDLLDTHLK